MDGHTVFTVFTEPKSQIVFKLHYRFEMDMFVHWICEYTEVEKILSFMLTCILYSEIFCQRKAYSASSTRNTCKIYGLYMIFPDIF